jgi:hypothetical protein
VIQGAFEDFNETIIINPNYANALYMRAFTKIYLKQKNAGCLDLSRAGELGMMEAYDAIKKFCQ